MDIFYFFSWRLSKRCKTKCTAFGWDRVNFLRKSLYDAMFWICAEKRR